MASSAPHPETAAPGAARGAARDVERSLAPDLARGFALLFIALANTPFYLWGASAYALTNAHPKDGSALDAVTQFVIILTVDGRTYPLFAFLFGYGMVQLYNRQIAGGTDERAARRLLHIRHAWLLVFGVVHAVLLWEGDILGAYGLAGLVLVALFFRRRDRTLAAWAIVLTGVLALFAAVSVLAGWGMSMVDLDPSWFPTGMVHAAQAEPNYAASVLLRLGTWIALVFVQGLFGLVVPVAILLGFWAARRRMLEEPGNHLRLLRRTAVLGIAIGWVGGVPGALVHLDVIAVPVHASWMFTGVAYLTGLACGIGYAALFGLLGHALSRRRALRPAPRRIGLAGAVMAVGKRSLSCYVMQSVLCAPLLAAWGLGWGAHMGSFDMALFAIAVWAVTVLLAAVWEAKGWRGPGEILLRRLVYRRTAA